MKLKRSGKTEKVTRPYVNIQKNLPHFSI